MTTPDDSTAAHDVPARQRPSEAADTADTAATTDADGPQPPRRIVARTPADLLAFVPVALGFVPEDSVVMVALGGSQGTFQARLDLPTCPDEVPLVSSMLVHPARLHAADAVVLLVYGPAGPDVAALVDRLRTDFADAAVEVVAVLRVEDGRWFRVDGGGEDPGTPFDLATHPLTAQAVLEGRVTLSSRGELRATLDRDAAAAARVSARLGSARRLRPDVLRDLLVRHQAARTAPSDEEAADILLTVVEGAGRDAAWSWLDRSSARGAVELWSGLVRRAGDDVVAGAASVLALAAWLSGNGALAWCAVDRARGAQPRHSLANLVAELLEGAVSPASWEAIRPGTGGATPAA